MCYKQIMINYFTPKIKPEYRKFVEILRNSTLSLFQIRLLVKNNLATY